MYIQLTNAGTDGQIFYCYSATRCINSSLHFESFFSWGINPFQVSQSELRTNGYCLGGNDLLPPNPIAHPGGQIVVFAFQKIAAWLLSGSEKISRVAIQRFSSQTFFTLERFSLTQKKKNATKSGGRVRVLRGQVRIPKLPTPPSRMVKPTTPKVVEQFSYSKTLVKQRVTRVTLQRGKVVKKKSRTRASRKKLFLLHYNDSLLEDSIFKLQ